MNARQNAAMKRLLSVEEALALVLARVPDPVEAKEPADLLFAVGCTLFEDVRADGDFPAWPRSRVDGYAVRAAETPRTLDVVCEVAAGSTPDARIASGQSARIFTGGAVPGGADAVVKQEDVSADGKRVTIPSRVEAGENVTPRGSECRAGDVVAARGTVITPALTGALASVGRASVRIARRPPVVVIPTGNELVPVTETPPPGRIRNSNAPALVAAMWSYGGWPESLPIVTDVRTALDDALETAFAKDPAIVLLTGGVSVGDYDLVPAALAAAGVERVLHGVNLQPGKPLWFGVRGTTLVFGLPGNPVSALVNAALFVRPALRKLSGRTDVIPETLVATLGAAVGAGVERRRFVPARTTAGSDGRLVATPIPYAGSGDVFGFSRADALIVVPERAPARAAGERCEVVPLSGTAR
jgi:molybdopterin molybdotransferase